MPQYLLQMFVSNVNPLRGRKLCLFNNGMPLELNEKFKSKEINRFSFILSTSGKSKNFIQNFCDEFYNLGVQNEVV